MAKAQECILIVNMGKGKFFWTSKVQVYSRGIP